MRGTIINCTLKSSPEESSTRTTGRAAAQNLVGVARALAAMPLGPPPSDD